MAGAPEKRKHSRVVATGVAAHLLVEGDSAPCTIQNISAGGLFMATDHTLPVGMAVAINLARPGWSRVLRLSGRVVGAQSARREHEVQPGLRIKFDPLPPEALEQLQRLLEELGAERPAPSGSFDDPSADLTPRALPAPIPLNTPVAESAPEKSRLIVQVQGLLMELGDLQSRLEEREKQLDQLRQELAQKEAQLRQAERDRQAAEMAVQRLSMQLANTRR